MTNRYRSGWLAGVAVLLTACGGGSGGATQPGTGTLALKITDGPIDTAEKVVIVFTGIELQRADGSRVTINLPRTELDLMTLQNGVTTNLVNGLAVEAGQYQWMRLMVLADRNMQDGSYIQINGARFPLYIPSGAETGLKLVRPFVVAQGSITRLLVDFDLRKSVHAPPGQAPNWFLRPALRLIDELQVGRVAGSVDLVALAAAQGKTPLAACQPGLYLFAGAGAKPDDMDGNPADGADPVVYSPLTNDGVTTTVSYAIPFVEAGNYTVAATCDYGVDVADSNDYDPNAVAPAPGQAPPPGFDTMKWSVRDATVATGQTTTVNLP